MPDLDLTLNDIPTCSLQALEALANEAPPPPESSKPPARKQGRGSSRKSDLGPLQIEKYLQHYGIEYSIKADAGKTLYRLKSCLFDQGHGRNEASIVQDSGGKLTYQCFHNSCKGRTWADARQKISGEAGLAEFCEGYDPARAPAPAAAQQIKDCDYMSVSKTGRVSFNVARFRDFLFEKLQPLINEGKDFGGLFYHYDPKGVWVPLPEAAIRKLADEALGDYSDPRRISNVVTILADRAFIMPDELTPDPMWLNLKNCMLHLPTMECAPHDPKYHSKVQLPVTYNPEAKCTGWTSALVEIFIDDTAKAFTLQEFFGYCLYPKVIFPCAIFQIGPGGNGKGTVQRVLESMLGQQNVCHISLQRMEDKWGPIELKDKLLNACGETSTRPLEVTNFKQIAAADWVQAQVKFGADVKFIPVAKHMISMNDFPGVADKTNAFFRRLIVMEYRQKFEGDDEKKNLGDKLVAEELDGVFMWALEGLKRVLEKEAISMPDSVIQAKHRFKAHVNHVMQYVDERCNKSGTVSPPVLYKDYLEWCEFGHFKDKQILGRTRFYEQIQAQFDVTRTRPEDSTIELFSGLSLKVPPLL